MVGRNWGFVFSWKLKIAICHGRGWGRYLVFLFPISAHQNWIQVHKKSIRWIFLRNTMHFTNTYTVLKIQSNWLWWGWQCLRPKIQWRRPPANYSIALQPNAFYHISHKIRLCCLKTSGVALQSQQYKKEKYAYCVAIFLSWLYQRTNPFALFPGTRNHWDQMLRVALNCPNCQTTAGLKLPKVTRRNLTEIADNQPYYWLKFDDPHSHMGQSGFFVNWTNRKKLAKIPPKNRVV